MFIPFIQRFESQALQNPYNKAITSPQEDLNFDYYTLNLNSNKIAHHLSTLGITKGDVIGFSSDRTIKSYLIILALLKLRVTIIPLDLDYPSDFLEFIIQDSKLSHIVSTNNLSENITQNLVAVNLTNFLQDLDNPNLITSNLTIEVSHDDLIYIIYTSGSTGKPKGICMSQSAVSEFLTWEMGYYDRLKNEKILQ